MTPDEIAKLARDGDERNQEMFDTLMHLYGEEAARAISTMANITILTKLILRMAGPGAMPVSAILAAEMAKFTNGYFIKLGLDASRACKDMDMFIRARELS